MLIWPISARQVPVSAGVIYSEAATDDPAVPVVSRPSVVVDPGDTQFNWELLAGGTGNQNDLLADTGALRWEAGSNTGMWMGPAVDGPGISIQARIADFTVAGNQIGVCFGNNSSWLMSYYFAINGFGSGGTRIYGVGGTVTPAEQDGTNTRKQGGLGQIVRVDVQSDGSYEYTTHWPSRDSAYYAAGTLNQPLQGLRCGYWQAQGTSSGKIWTDLRYATLGELPAW